MHPIISKIRSRLFRPSETIAGYEHPELVEVVFRKTLAYKPHHDWPEIAGAETVLDFGGGCGRHYKEAQSSTVKWAVVETPAMVRRACELSTENLRFFSSIDDATEWLGPVDVMHSNGALHFSSDPEQTAKRLCSIGAKKMLWYRMYLAKGDREEVVQSSNLIDNGPGIAPLSIKNKIVTYGYTKIPETDFVAAHIGYCLTARGDDWFHFQSLR